MFRFTNWLVALGRKVELTPPLRALKRPSDRVLRSSPARKEARRQARKRKLDTVAATTSTPVPKRVKNSSDRDTDSDLDSKEHFNPELEKEDKEEFKTKVPKTVGKYLEKHFRRSLSKEERTAMLKKYPKPDTDASAPPKLDGFISEDSWCPASQNPRSSFTSLWADLIDQGLTHDPSDAIHVTDVLEVIQRSLVLLGNANNVISETRREVALESVHPSLKKYAKGDFTQWPLWRRVQTNPR